MSTSRTWIISSGVVGAISLMLRTVLNFSFTGARVLGLLPTLNPLFIITGIIFALAASTSLSGNESDSPDTNDDTYHYEQDHQYDDGRDRSSSNSSNSSFDQYNNKVHEEKFPVRSESIGSKVHEEKFPVKPHGVSSPEVRFPPTAPEKPVGIRRPPTAPVKTFPQDNIPSDDNETMEEMWERVKAEKQPKRRDTTMSTSSWPSPSSSPSPSRASRKPTPSLSPSSSRARGPPSSPARPGMKLMERIPSWVKLKKSYRWEERSSIHE